MTKRAKKQTIRPISDSEWEIMNVLWDCDGARASEILERLPAETTWKRKTINTFLARLVEKGVVSVKKDGHVNHYRWAISREDCVSNQSASFLKRVFRGAAAPMLMHFLENEELTAEEIAALKKVLGKNQKS